MGQNKKFFTKNKFEDETNNIIVEEIQTTNSSYEAKKENNFLNHIKLKSSSNSSLEDLQYLIRNKQIKEEDLSEKQKEDLRKLYKSQISELKNSIQMYKHKIIRLKNKNMKKVFN